MRATSRSCARSALHDEFGLYAAGAIAELAPQRQQALYEMAQKLDGWGRIEAVTLMTATPDRSCAGGC